MPAAASPRCASCCVNTGVNENTPNDDVGFCWSLTSARYSPPNLTEWLPAVLLKISDHDHVSLTVNWLPWLPNVV